MEDKRSAERGIGQTLHSDRREKTELLIKYCYDDGCRTLLDVGCDEGFFCGYAEQLGYLQVVGVDYVAYRKTPSNFVLADAESLPIRPKSMDVSLITEVLEHLPDPIRTLKSVRNIARGYVVVSVPGPKAEWGGVQAVDQGQMERIDYRSHIWYIPKRILEKNLKVCKDLSAPTRTILMSKED